MTWYIINRKTNKFKMSIVAFYYQVVFYLLNCISFYNFFISFIYFSIANFLYHIYYGYKLFEKTLSNFDRKTDKFKIFWVAVSIAIVVIAFILSSFLSVLLFKICLKWFNILLIKNLINLRCLISLLLLSLFAITIYYSFYFYAWVIHFFVPIWYF